MRELEHFPGSPAWHLSRRGVVSASEAHKFIQPSNGELRKGDMPRTYMADKLAEMVGWTRDDFQGSVHTQRGHDLEPHALRWAAMDCGHDARPCSFILSDCGRYGCTPDCWFDDGAIGEVKAPAENTYFRWLLDNDGKPGLPIAHKLQVHFQLAVTGAALNRFVVYTENGSLENWRVDVEPDEFTAKVKVSIEEFCDELWSNRKLISDPAYHED